MKSFSLKKTNLGKRKPEEEKPFLLKEGGSSEEKLRFSLKGISPLIATVILIALTMAIAGLMAAFATQITSSRIAESQAKSNCLGSIDLSSINFQNTTLSVKVTNQQDRINLTGMTADIEYSDAVRSKNNSNLKMKDYNFSDPLIPTFADWFIYDAKDATVPKSIFVFAANCGRDFGTRLIIR